jgi:predicted SnoaL-like aldol condensation-catalyzing enzyme
MPPEGTTIMTTRHSAKAHAMLLILGITVSGLAFGQSPPGTAPMREDPEANRKVVLEFQEKFFNKHDVAVANRLIGDTYVQHNPSAPNGRAALIESFSKVFLKYPMARSEVLRSAVDQDLVFVHVRSTLGAGDRGNAIVNIFRVSNGQIVEHWDVIQPVPAEAKNANSMF